MANGKQVEAGVSTPKLGHSEFEVKLNLQAKVRTLKTLKRYGFAHISNRELQTIYGCKRVGRQIKAGMTNEYALYVRDPSAELGVKKCESGYIFVVEGGIATKK